MSRHCVRAITDFFSVALWNRLSPLGHLVSEFYVTRVPLPPREVLVDLFTREAEVKCSIRLYPNVHRYTAVPRRETTEHAYRRLFARRKPLFQHQDHVVIYRGLRGKGLI
jgi:hypothetical protein